MKKKKKNISKKKLLLIFIPIILVFVIVMFGIDINRKNDREGVFSIGEKRWIESNKSKVVDVAIINDLPIFGSNGEGVFFDFIDDFNKDTDLQFNLIPYKTSGKSESNYTFEITNKTDLDDNELLFYTDNYILVSKNNKKVKSINDLNNVTIGSLEQDVNNIKSVIDENSQIIFNSYESITDLTNALNNNDILYAAIPKTNYINFVFSNNYYIVNNISELTNNYILRINGDEDTLNTIVRKFYIRWSKSSLEESYNRRLLSLYFDKKSVDDETIANFEGKEYTYGYVKNIPYESKINDEFIGYNSEMLDSFAKSMNITFKVKEYGTVDELTNDLNAGNVDIAFNYYDFKDLKGEFEYTFSPYNEKIVVLTHVSNVKTSVQSLKTLKDKKVYMMDNKLATYLEKQYGAKPDVYKKSNSLFNAIDQDSIVVLDYNLYDSYRNSELTNYKVVYEDRAKDVEFNFIISNSSKNKAFVDLFKFYISTLQQDLYMARAKVKYSYDSKKLDLTFVYILVGLLILLMISLFYLRHKYSRNRISKNDRMKYVDSLTSLKNRHYLNKNYEKWQENKIYPQSIVIIDVNKIGHINDVYGHAEGDMVLKKAANILINNQLEQSDIVRTNGDEFLIYMIGYEENKVIAYMRKLNKEFKTLPYNFGATLGYSMILDDIKTIDDAINEAVLEVKTSKEMNNLNTNK
ncbi:MAG: GGDEF domain-containing protein [Bacilli bacterium]|nr:GGDEF domain-containing protein [Bacilli bacterium]